MLYAIAAILLILWLFGMIATHTIGGMLSVLLAISIVAVLLRVISARRPQ